MLGRTLRLSSRPVQRIAFVLAALSAIPCLWACDHEGTSKPPYVDGGLGGEGGCPVRAPEPLFVLDIRAEDGPVPPDTRVMVEWSAGVEPPFVLSDQTTWKTLDDGSNLVCVVPVGATPPVTMTLLPCELWASGAVNVRVEAEGYEPHQATLSAEVSELCGVPMPMEVAVVLMRAKMDGGAPP